MSNTQALKHARRRACQAADALAEAKSHRDDAIRAAHRAGMTTREISLHAGVSHQRVAQIVHSRD